jgi:hypothetical protein
MKFILEKNCLIAALAVSLALTAACATKNTNSTNPSTNPPVAEPTAVKPVTEVSKSTSASFKADLSIEPGDVKSNQTVKLSFAIKDPSSKVISDLEIVHEKPIHLLVISDELAYFDHIHPELGAAGKYSVETRYPTGGKYKLYADYTPKGEVQQINCLDINVAGESRTPVKLIADKQNTKTVGGLKVTMKSDKPLKAGDNLMLEFKVFDALKGKPVRDLQPCDYTFTCGMGMYQGTLMVTN